MEVKKNLNNSPIAVAKHYEQKHVSLYSTIDRYLRVLGVYAYRQVAFLRITVGGLKMTLMGVVQKAHGKDGS